METKKVNKENDRAKDIQVTKVLLDKTQKEIEEEEQKNKR